MYMYMYVLLCMYACICIYVLIMVTLIVSFMKAWCVLRTVTRHPQLFGFSFVCISCPTVGRSTVSPITFVTTRRDQRVHESNEYVSTRQSEALEHVGLFVQWLAQRCNVAFANVWHIVLIRHG